jgi:hypothetical protein
VSVVDDATRAILEARAGYRCEYCRLPLRGQVAAFPVDHIIPRMRDGPSNMDNLAVACPRCNSGKWAHTHGIDPVSGESVGLFHPRRDRWEDHFRWSATEPAILEGISPSGRATIARLQMNHARLVETRRLLAAIGAFPGN